MSKLFYDHLISESGLENFLREVVEDSEEREELWLFIDEIIHQRVLGCILDNLPHEHHEDFLLLVHKTPYDEGHIHYLNERIGHDAEKLIKREIDEVISEVLQDFR